jgi:hypothetical protein
MGTPSVRLLAPLCFFLLAGVAEAQKERLAPADRKGLSISGGCWGPVASHPRAWLCTSEGTVRTGSNLASIAWRRIPRFTEVKPFDERTHE